MITLTIRIIKSFEYRNFKNLVLHVDPLMTVSELKSEISKKLPKGCETIAFDTLKIYVKAHGSKTSNLIINLDNDAMLDDEKSLADQGIENETEISFFVLADYLKYKENPSTKW